jgi:hypothetical protein
LGADPENEDDYYTLLGVERDATPDEIKRAYKRQSLQMHPDKLAQKGKVVTEADQARFTHMKEAYEILSDPHKKETYDAIGKRGMKWIEEPFSLDPQELAHNFATSSHFDRSKIFAIFVGIFVAVFMLPLFICLQVDGAFGKASWVAVLTPLWIWDIAILFYHTRVIMMGPIQRPEHVPADEWVDPLPMKKRYFSMFRFALIVLFEFLAALKLDNTLKCYWAVVFIPLYIWEATTLYKKFPLARMRIVTVEDLETALGKPFAEFTPAEKELIAKRYSVVPSTNSPEFEAAQKLKTRARHDMIKSGFRIAFVVLLLVQLDGDMGWSWWFVFAPFWIMTGLFCYANYQSFSEVQQMAMEKDPTLFGLKRDTDETANYGAVGKDGDATPSAANEGRSELTVEEQEELKAQVMASSSRLCSKCCSQGFLLLIVVLFVGKIQGAGYSAVWIISPFLFVAGIILCCLGCAIFGITEVPTDGVDFDTGEISDSGTYSDTPTQPAAASPTPGGTAAYVPPPPSTQAGASAQTSTPDMEQGQAPTTDATPITTIPEPSTETLPSQTTPADLLDIEQGQQPADNKDSAMQNSLHELD